MTSRPIVAIALGALIGLLLSSFMGWLGDYVFPPSVLADMNPQLARTLPMPVGEILMQLIGWGGGVVMGSILALRFSDEIEPWLCWVVAAIFAVACVALTFVSPHPIWFVALCVIVIAVAGYLSGRMLIHEAEYVEPGPPAYAPESAAYEPEPPHLDAEPAAYEPEPQAYPPRPEGEEDPAGS